MRALQARIRKVGPSDIDRIVAIERSWRHLSHWSLESYHRLLNDEAFTPSYVAEVQDGDGAPIIAGFVIFHVAADVAEIYNIAVEAPYARTGIGRRLMIAVIEESRRRKASKLMLEVRKSNSTAIGFYVGFGFRICGERKNYYSNPVEDAYVMEKELGS